MSETEALRQEVTALKGALIRLSEIIRSQTIFGPSAKDVIARPEVSLSHLAVVAGRLRGIGEEVQRLESELHWNGQGS